MNIYVDTETVVIPEQYILVKDKRKGVFCRRAVQKDKHLEFGDVTETYYALYGFDSDDREQVVWVQKVKELPSWVVIALLQKGWGEDEVWIPQEGERK